MKSLISLLLFATVFFYSAAQTHFRNNDGVDIIKYMINIEVNDTTDKIEGLTGLKIMLANPVQEVVLNLASEDIEGQGMVVDSVLKNGIHITYRHQDNLLYLPAESTDSEEVKYEVFYHGIPSDGLIISENMYGERTWFADNWPDRAHNWFPCIDHPSSRAMVDFTITAPSQYQVIATGLLEKMVNLPGKRTAHYWSSSVPVPTKVMVFGAAGFAVEYQAEINGIPWSNWVYPQNMDEGFYDFAITPGIMDFFTGLIGPYPNEKIANVQSTTRYGGMENAGNIFYHERSIKGDRSNELTIVHEMARQWFGNSVSESDWAHLWLSEGIATWLTGLYVEQVHDEDRLKERLENHRTKIIEYSKTRLAPIVGHHTEDYIQLLNPNTCQKAAWVLHMLNEKIGRDNFISGLVRYYNEFRTGSAGTDDFLKVMEEVSGTDLEEFADDWIYSAGHPVISLNTRYSDGRLLMEMTQMQQHKMAFTFPVDIRLVMEDGTDIFHTFEIVFRRHEFVIDLPSEPFEIIVDPDIKLLFEMI